ncbi:MAG: protein kinase domain-containing protein [Gemmatimonadaceae bacterium]
MVHQSSERLNPDLGGRYVIEREIGRGGMAVVYLADDVRHHRKVAIKLLHGDLLSTAGVARFLREIEIVGRLTHPNIVSLFDSGETAGLPYYVMPFIQGESLRDWLNREPQLPVPVALRVGGVVADALSYAHAHGVIHRDVKPENVLCQGEHVFVTDFGVARALTAAADSRITQAGSVVGSPAYMSPEQVAGEVDIDVRSDVYSLSCVVYEMLAGAPPFAGYTGQALIARRLTVSAPPIRTVRPQVSVAVELALARGLATAPQERWPTATAFAQALTHTTAAPMQEGRRSIGVLPFVNLSSQPDTEYFADGITEDVIAQLSRIRALKVISRTSVMRFKGTALSLREVASSLDVSAILEGSVRRAGDRVRIVAQLIDAASDEHLWAETYDRELTDIFAIQSDVAVHIANALQAELTPVEKARMRRQPTTSITAYQWYLRGRQQLILYTAEGIRRAIADFEQAIVHDSQYALAWASIALGFLELGEAGSLASQEAYQRAREAAARALELDDLLAEALTAQGHLKFVSDFDWAGAEQAFRSALELNPNSADTCDLLGRMLTAIGRHDEALVVQRRAQALDPLAHKSDVATTLLRARRYEEALSVASLAVDVDPENARAQATLGWAYVKLARNAEGLAALERAVELSNGSTLWLAQLGEAYGLAGQREKALEILGTLERVGREGYVSPYHFAYVLTGLGESDRALDWLERAFEERAGAIYGIKASFLFEPLRDHSRFRSLVRRMNLD